MPRYHFNVHDGTAIPDLDGMELSGLEAARREALRYAADLLHDMGRPFWDGEPWAMEVTDSTGLTLFRLDFSAHEAASICGARHAH